MITRNAVKFLSLCLCLSLVVSGWVLPEAKAAVPVSKVTWNTELQKVDGFGGSGAFHKAGSIMRLQEPLRTQILDMIFSRESGIGISIVRNMMGDGGTWGSKEYDGPTETIEPEKGVFVWDDPQWATKKADFDKYQIWFMNEAKKRGVTTFMTSSWSPPAWMKTNNSVLGTGNGKLKKENYQDYADYLAEYVLGYKKHFDLDISYISLANEPNIGPAYSGTVWTADEMNVFIRDYLGPTFAARKVPAKIVMPEHVNFTEAYALPALNDPVTVNYVDVVATHAYGIGTNVPEFPVSREKGKPIWQTEYMNQGTGLQTFENNTITDALRYANLIGNMFDNTGISAYFWWWPAANNGADGSDLIRLSNDGSNQALAPTENGQYRVFKRYYSFGNYSRFIRPGYVMIGADKNPVDEVMVTAYKDPQTGNFSIVAVNNDSGPQTITFDLQDFPGGVDAVVPYRTSPNENLKKLGDIAVSGQSFTMELKGSSVTTFIPKKYELPALPEQKDVFSTYEAEENDGQSPGVKATVGSGGGQAVTGLSNGDYIKYANVNFADGSANGEANKRYVLSMNARVAAQGGGKIEIRLDDPASGKVVGTLNVPPLNDPGRWLTVSTMIDTNSADGAYGFHDMYVVFTGGRDGKMFNVDSFAFNDGNLAPAIGDNLLANPGFESGSSASPWIRSHGGGSDGTVNTVTTSVYSGSRAGRLLNRQSADPTVGIGQSILNKLYDQLKYEVTGYFYPYNSGFEHDTASIYLRVTSASKGIYTVPVAQQELTASAWTAVKGQFTFEDPGDVSALQLVYTTTSSTTNFYLDDTGLKELASQANAVTLYGADAVSAGESFVLTYALDGSQGEIAAQDITVSYDPQKLELADNPLTPADDEFIVADYKQIPGQIRILAIHLGGLQANPDGDLLKLHFKSRPDAQAGTTDVTISNLVVASSAGVEKQLEGTSHSVQINVIDKQALTVQIEAAQEAYDAAVEGSQVGQYPAGSRAVLLAAINSAQAVHDSQSSAQAQIEQAAAELHTALQTFLASVIVSVGGDYNHDNKVSVGDLALMVKAYGSVSTDPDWNDLKQFDLNNDNVIDIQDLVTVARLIINWQ